MLLCGRLCADACVSCTLVCGQGVCGSSLQCECVRTRDLCYFAAFIPCTRPRLLARMLPERNAKAHCVRRARVVRRSTVFRCTDPCKGASNVTH